jgi:thiopeptide-type bacteriocin biosynthesis protein
MEERSVSIPSRYRPAGIMLARATTYAADLDLPHDVDLTDDTAILRDGRAWLARVWADGCFREALEIASPALAAQIDAVLSEGSGRTSPRNTRRAVLSAISYLARWQRRTTPFGLFAGVTAAAAGERAQGRIGADHRVHLRADAEWLGALVDHLERHPLLRRRLLVSADNTHIVRDGRVIVAGRPNPGTTPGPVRELSVANTRPVQAVLTAAANPIWFDTLAAHLRSRFPRAATEKIDQLLSELIDQQILTTSLRAPMTSVDGLAHLLETLRAASAHELPDISTLINQLEVIADGLLCGAGNAFSPEGARRRRSAAAMMRALVPNQSGHPMAVDVQLDAKITIPESVVREAADAADVLLRLSTKPFGSSAWLDYHARFRARYGPGAIVPVRDLVADSGLGYPAGYLGAPRARPTWRMITERDATLLALIQRAGRDGTDQILLTEPVIRSLTVGEHADAIPPQRVELGFELHAATLDDIDHGKFELWVDATPRAGSSMVGRFAYLLDEASREQLAASFTAEAPNAVVMQLSFPPRRLHNENVVRTPQLLPDVIRISEHNAGAGTATTPDDLGVTADAEQLYLVHLATGHRVAPRTLHALDVTVQTPTLARFLSEVADARSAVFSPFDFGAARSLPHTPRIRYRRTILAPARWLLSSADLGDTRVATIWEKHVRAWAEEWRVPANVVLCRGELRLPLDLERAIDRALLRAQIERSGQVELREAGAAEAYGWLGVPSQMLVPLNLKAPLARQPPAVTARPSAALNAGHGDVIHIELIGNPARFDEILTKHIPRAVAGLGEATVVHWWARRHRDMIRFDADQYLSLCLRMREAERYGPVAAQLAQFGGDLQARGLLAWMAIASYQPQAGRYGEAEALTAAERVFAADTAAALAQIRLAIGAPVPAQALAAASMAVLSGSFAPAPDTGFRLLKQLVRQETGPLDRSLRDCAIRLADPAGGYNAVAALPGGAAVAQAWLTRDEALTSYHRVLSAQRDPSTVLRSLLHDHHVRALGVDPTFEATTNRLARSCALRRLALAEAGNR